MFLLAFLRAAEPHGASLQHLLPPAEVKDAVAAAEIRGDGGEALNRQSKNQSKN